MNTEDIKIQEIKSLAARSVTANNNEKTEIARRLLAFAEDGTNSLVVRGLASEALNITIKLHGLNKTQSTPKYTPNVQNRPSNATTSKETPSKGIRKTAIVSAFIAGALDIVFSIIAILLTVIQLGEVEISFIVSSLTIVVLLRSLPLIAAFISRRKMRAAGVMLIIIGAYRIISELFAVSSGTYGQTATIIFAFLIPTLIIASGILCLAACSAQNKNRVRREVIIPSERNIQKNVDHGNPNFHDQEKSSTTAIKKRRARVNANPDQQLLVMLKSGNQMALQMALSNPTFEALAALEETIALYSNNPDVTFYQLGGQRVYTEDSVQSTKERIMDMALSGSLLVDPAYTQSLIAGLGSSPGVSNLIMSQLATHPQALYDYQLLGVHMQLAYLLDKTGSKCKEQ